MGWLVAQEARKFATHAKDSFMFNHNRVGTLECRVTGMGTQIATDIHSMNLMLSAKIVVLEKVRL